jgi:hypothetical protein
VCVCVCVREREGERVRVYLRLYFRLDSILHNLKYFSIERAK